MVEAERVAQRQWFRAKFGDDAADVNEALEPLWSARPDTLTEAQRAIVLIHGLAGLVDGDGFETWLSSDGGEWAATRDSLRLLGLDRAADLVEEAVRIAGGPDAFDWETVDLDALRELDERFYALGEVRDDALTQLTLEFMRRHPDDFALPDR